MKKLLLILCIIFCVSCVTQKKCYQKFPPKETRDSSYVEKITIKPVAIPGFSNNISTPVINCPDQLLVDIENSKLKQKIAILNGKLIAQTDIKPDTIKVPVVEALIKVKEVKIPQPVKYVPKFYKYCLVFSLLVLVYIILRIFKKI